MLTIKVDYEANDEGKWSLEGAVVGYNGSDDDECVEERAGYGEAEDDPCDQVVDGEEVFREGGAEEEESSLKHKR